MDLMPLSLDLQEEYGTLLSVAPVEVLGLQLRHPGLAFLCKI